MRSNAYCGNLLWQSSLILQAPEFVQPGFVVGHYNPVDSGHCGIVDFDGWGIAAGKDNVNRRFGEWFDTTSGLNIYNGVVDE